MWDDIISLCLDLITDFGEFLFGWRKKKKEQQEAEEAAQREADRNRPL